MKRVIGVPVAKRLALEHPGFARRSPDERRERALVLVAQSVTVDARRRSEQPSFRAPLLDVATKALAEKINAFATRIV